MIYCKFCGSELKGAKKFCMVCGKPQEKSDDEKRIAASGSPLKREKAKESEEGTCNKCGEETDKKCYFCSEFVCRDHYTRMQANVHPYVKMQQYLTENETKRINEGWRGLIILSCPKCLRLKVGKQLTNEEILAINTVDDCSWYKLESQL